MRKLMISISLILLTAGGHLSAVFSSDLHVYPYQGAQAPNGSADQPYQSLESAICAAQPGDTILLAVDDYLKHAPGIASVTLDKPVTIKSYGRPGFDSFIGRSFSGPHTRLKVVTYNTHLFGDEALGLPQHFHDAERAHLIATALNATDADIVTLNEVWDEELASLIRWDTGAEFPYQYYSNETEEFDDILNSGLLLLSRHPLLNLPNDPKLTFYDEEEGCTLDLLCIDGNGACDGCASKGFITATIVKDGFRLGIFMTHAQSEHSAFIGAGPAKIRAKQLQQLDNAMSTYRNAHPDAEVVALGDFNVPGGSAEYTDTLKRHMNWHDAYLNAPWCQGIPCCGSVEACPEELGCTFAHVNDLVDKFGDLEDKLFDYVFYTHNSGPSSFSMQPLRAEIRRDFVATPPLEGVSNLSDHYPLEVEFQLSRN